MTHYERKVTKIGNSYGVTFPKELLKEAGISYGDNLHLEQKDGEITLRKSQPVQLSKGISADFFDVLERNTQKHAETLRELVDR